MLMVIAVLSLMIDAPDLLAWKNTLAVQASQTVGVLQVERERASSSGTHQQHSTESDAPVDLFESVDSNKVSGLQSWAESSFAGGAGDDDFVRYDFFRPNIPAIASHFSKEIDVFSPPVQNNPGSVFTVDTVLSISLADDKKLELKIDRMTFASAGRFGVSGYPSGNPADTRATFVIDAVSGRLISGDVFDGAHSHTVFETPETGVYLMLETPPKRTFIDDELLLEDER